MNPLVFMLAIAAVSLAAATANFAAQSEGISMRLAFHIGDSKSDDTFEVQNGYIIAQGNGVSVAIVSVGTAIGTQSDTSFSSSDSSIEARALGGDFVLAFINATNGTITSKMPLNGMPSAAIAPLSYSISPSFPIYVRLEYPFDIISRARMPAGNTYVLVRNEGKDARGVTRISVTVP
ncbi:MAG: hypothetical protein HY365_03465 [Candidatus Aenigmarchaeota archaeon]|nr:hypothetical protein [Candidatus Aenigmarchaeota archaeon]